MKNQKKKYKHPKVGEEGRRCIFCGHTALIRRYGMSICRQCFREKAPSLGFKKY